MGISYAELPAGAVWLDGLSHHVSERRGKQVLYSLNQARLAASCCQVAEDFAPEYPIEIQE
jgi:hypothetical protein